MNIYDNYYVSLGGYGLTTTKCLLQSLKNGGFPSTVYSKTKRGGYSGTKIVTPQFSSYQLAMEFKISGDSFSDIQTQYDTFCYILGLVHSLGSQTLQITRPDGIIVQIDIKAVEVIGDLTADDGVSRSVMIILSAEYPFFRSSIPKSQDVLLNNGGGIAVPMIVPMPMSGGAIPNVSMINSGNYSAYTEFTFVGPVHHPAIVNQTTGLTLSIAYDLATSADSMVVDTYLRTVIIKPSGNVGRQYSSGSFWTMPIGISVLNLTTTNGGDTGKCTVSFRDTYLNV